MEPNSVVSGSDCEMSSGPTDQSIFKGPESAPITNPSFWAFNIWDPGLSSTTSTSTVPPTVGTVTTRAPSTTPLNTNVSAG